MNINKTVVGKGEEVVVLHGWGCNSLHMQPVVDQLSNRYRVTNVDLPGRGGSEWSSSIQNIHDMADLLIAALPKQAIYVGWSFGGVVSMSIAARYPERVKRFIGVTTTPKFVEAENWLGVSAPGFKPFFTVIEQIGFNEFFRGYYDGEFAGFDPKPKAYHQLIDLLNDQSWDLDILLKGLSIIDNADLRKEFALIKTPIDLILGEKDTSMLISSIDQIKKLNSNVNTHVVQGAQHMPFWTHPREFNKILNNIM